MNRGGTPILSSGLKAQSIGSSAKDSELADLLKLSDQAVANVYRVPLQVLGIGDTPFASTEALMMSWARRRPGLCPESYRGSDRPAV